MQVLKRDGSTEELNIAKMRKVIQNACEGLECDPLELEMDAQIQFRDGMTTREIQQALIKVATEKTSVQATNWRFVSARLLAYDIYKDAMNKRGHNHFGYGDFYELIKYGTDIGKYGKYLLEKYDKNQIKALGKYLKPENDDLLDYAGLRLLKSRYLVDDYDGTVIELPQERFMVIAMHLAMDENDHVKYAKMFYDNLTNLWMMTATPTLANGGTAFPQLSSCFIDSVDDSLWSIKNTDMSVSMVSKYGGGVGIYMGKIRSLGAKIRGMIGKSGGLIPWVQGYNNTATSVDQLGVRQGAFALYTDIWSKDIFDFLLLKTVNGDQRRKAFDIFPGVCIPDLFMEQVKNRGSFWLFDPHEIREVMGYSIEDFWGKEFEKRYWECVNSDKLVLKQEVKALTLFKAVLEACFETGTPFIFFRDTANRMNPMKTHGIIYCSNLCTEIMQNTRPAELIAEELDLETGVITVRKKAGTFVVCNLSSLNAGRIDSHNDLERVITAQVRMLDNVIDHNFYPDKSAEYTNKNYRAIGLGVMGLDEYRVKKEIKWESEEFIKLNDELFEDISYFAIKASHEIALEKGSFPLFENSEWHTGEYFVVRGLVKRDALGYISPVKGKKRWFNICINIMKYGIRNAYIMAVAPTGSISLIAGTTATTDPIFKKFFVDEKKDGIVPQVAPNLNSNNFFLYKEAHQIDQIWSIRAQGARQRWIDQGNSFNLYVPKDVNPKMLFDMYMTAWEEGLKSVYYMRNLSNEIEAECVSCT